MSTSDEERTVRINLGWWAWLFAVATVATLAGISSRLGQIVVEMKIANCLTEANHGVLCPDASEASHK